MKATGIVRKIDDLGRIVIPKELRETMNINVKDPIEIYVTNNGEIVLKKYQPACVFCGETSDVIEYKGKVICRDCLDSMAEKKSS
ncbi:MAG: AbrB/MazE/SpoVT family DNA-binding domain-containing protein [Nanoarchaeota archaeon]